MKTKQDTIKACNAIREVIDTDVSDSDITSVTGKLHALTCLQGLSAEANASAKKFLSQKELEVLMGMDKLLPPSIQSKTLNAECWEELALLEYADRLNSAIVHSIDAYRSIISLYKTELEKGLI